MQGSQSTQVFFANHLNILKVLSQLCVNDSPFSIIFYTLDDFLVIGTVLRSAGVPTIFVQEGGYDMGKLGTAVANTMLGFCNRSVI